MKLRNSFVALCGPLSHPLVTQITSYLFETLMNEVFHVLFDCRSMDCPY